MDANGALDRAFVGGGFLLMASPRYLWGGSAAVVQPDGKLLILGSLVDEASDDAEGVVLVRLNPDGTTDASFGAQ
jgi:predicted amidohydrolase